MTQATPRSVAIVAGEASGDTLGAGLIAAIRRRYPDVTFAGIAGPKMMAQGCGTAFPMERLSVMGLFEVAGRYVELVPARAKLARSLLAAGPDLFVGIDAPEFNLWLERRLKRGGVPVAHYVSPSVWAWRRHRLDKIATAVDKMLCLFPFEPPIYRERGIAAEFVGHPLADQISSADPELSRAAARKALGLRANVPTIALLPGSRITEVSRLAGPMVDAALWLNAREPAAQFILPAANSRCLEALSSDVARCENAGLDLHVLGGGHDSGRDGGSLAAMAAADVVLTASGTATLEAMLVGRPMVITYRAMELTWQIARRLSYVSQVGLPNLLAGHGLVPELLQSQANGAALGAALLTFIRRPDLSSQVEREFQAIAETIRRDADERACDAVLGLLK